jgi:hypothetical protein
MSGFQAVHRPGAGAPMPMGQQPMAVGQQQPMAPGMPGGGVLPEGSQGGLMSLGGAMAVGPPAPPVHSGGGGGGLNSGMGMPRAPLPPGAHGTPLGLAMPSGGLNVMRKPRREGKEARSRPYNKARCPHNRDHYSCRDCGGAGICVHKRRKSQVRRARGVPAGVRRARVRACR